MSTDPSIIELHFAYINILMKVNVLGKQVIVQKKGWGSTPMLVVGVASLFRKNGMLPKELYEHFTIYFADLFEVSETITSADYSLLTLDDFVEALEQVRVQLELGKVALLAHSANGVLALEYANKYSKNVLFNTLIGTMPIWGEYRKKAMTKFFLENASENRKKIDDRVALIPASVVSPMGKFVAQYNSRKAQFFEDNNLTNSHAMIDKLWDGLTFDIELVNSYFSAISDYDLRERSCNTPTFVALGLYDASCPLFTWTDDIRKWYIEGGQILSFEKLFKLYIFESDHYLMSPVFNQAKPDLFVEKLLEYMEPFMISSDLAELAL